MTRGGVIAATAGALLVVSLLLPWWGAPPRLLDPPGDLPAELALVSVILIALVLIRPPDYIEFSNDLFDEAGGPGFRTEYDLPFGREAGAWIGLAAALGVGASAGLVLRGRRS